MHSPRSAASAAPVAAGEKAEPWRVLVPLSLAGIVLIGGMLTSLSVLVSVMQKEFGWSAAAAGAGPVALLLGMCGGNLLVSPLTRWLGVGGSFAASCAVAAAGWAAGGYVTSLVQFAVAMGLAGAGAGAATIVPGIALLTHMFTRHRGMAIALFIGSCALASSTVPMLTGHLVEQLGWRTTFFAVAACALALVPLMLRLLPRSMPVAADADTSSLAASLPPRGAMRLPAFWLLTAVLTISQVCMNGVLFNIVAYLTANGLDRSDAIALYSLTNFMNLPGLVIGGLISDRVAARTLLPLILALQAAGTLALLGIGAPFPFGLAATAAFVIVWGGIAGLPAQAGSLALKDVAGSAISPTCWR